MPIYSMFFRPEAIAPWTLLQQGIGTHVDVNAKFGAGLGADSKHKGRPMVWEIREVREESNHDQFASRHLFP
jgi:hypothetical protein